MTPEFWHPSSSGPIQGAGSESAPLRGVAHGVDWSGHFRPTFSEDISETAADPVGYKVKEGQTGMKQWRFPSVIP